MRGTGGRIRDARLSPHRIRGVSFHRQRASKTSSGHGRMFQTERPPQLDEASLADARPPALRRQDIHRLMYDTSRVELHAMVIDCIDHVSHWKQLSHAFDNYISMRRANDENETLSSEPGRVTNDHFLATEAHAIFALWRHRLEMLEWISQSQFSLIKFKR